MTGMDAGHGDNASDERDLTGERGAPADGDVAAAAPTFPGLLAQTVDLAAVRHNIAAIKKASGAHRLMAVVKADGYNHGMVDVARAALAGGAAALGVATLGEAIALRGQGVDAPLTAWMWLADPALEDLRPAVELDITLGIPSLEHLRAAVEVSRTALAEGA